MGKLTGKIAWVTGAGTGIGEAAALALAEEGATIVLTGRRPAPLQDVAARIRAQSNATGAAAHVQPADLMMSPQVLKVGAFIKDTLGRLDVLANNAGLNIMDRFRNKLTAAGIDDPVHGNPPAALCCVTAAPLKKPICRNVTCGSSSP